jgi:hypothetical protein
MNNEQRFPGQVSVVYNGTDWGFAVRGRQRANSLAFPYLRYELAGRSEQESDGSVSFHASEAQVAVWEVEAERTGRDFEQIVRYHLVTGVDVRGPDGLVLTMICQPRGDA